MKFSTVCSRCGETFLHDYPEAECSCPPDSKPVEYPKGSSRLISEDTPVPVVLFEDFLPAELRAGRGQQVDLAELARANGGQTVTPDQLREAIKEKTTKRREAPKKPKVDDGASA